VQLDAGSNQFGTNKADAAWTLTASQCKLTFNGANGSVWKCKVTAAPSNACNVNAFLFLAVDLNGDRVGVQADTSFAETMETWGGPPLEGEELCVTCERVLTLNTNDIIFPVLGATTGSAHTGVDTFPDRMVVTLTQVS